MMIQKTDHQKQQQTNYLKEAFYFLFLVTLIYTCYITSGVYHQKILKHAYLNHSTGKHQYFEEAIVFTLFPQLFGTFVGYFYLFFLQKQKTDSSNFKSQKKSIPWKKALVCGLVVNFNMFTYNMAVVQASFPAVVMVKSCSLLSVIIVGVFCSRVKDKSVKLKSNKIIIGIVACIGIFVFNYFKKTEHGSVDKPITLVSSLLLLASLIGDGFLPDLQAQLKTEYKPTVMEMYLQINKFTLIVAVGYSIVTGKLFYFFQFFASHNEITFDIIALSVLNSLGQIVIYKMVKLYKQHIPAFVIGIRKCLTVVVNIIYFGHSINSLQSFAILFVFSSILWETYDNYLQKKQKENIRTNHIPIAVQDILQNQQIIDSNRPFSPTSDEDSSDFKSTVK